MAHSGVSATVTRYPEWDGPVSSLLAASGITVDDQHARRFFLHFLGAGHVRATIPEPASMTLIGLGLAGLAWPEPEERGLPGSSWQNSHFLGGAKASGRCWDSLGTPYVRAVLAPRIVGALFAALLSCAS